MKKLGKWVLILGIIFFVGCKADDVEINDGTLAGVINEYRQNQGLSVIPISQSLTTVAQKHVEDLAKYYTIDAVCNLHSWSDKGEWNACCYTADHAEADCMWDKPRELTSYQGNGYEIAAYNSAGITAEIALEYWKASSGHHDVILNRNSWASSEWNAIGAAIKDGHAVVWFGKERDQ